MKSFPLNFSLSLAVVGVTLVAFLIVAFRCETSVPPRELPSPDVDGSTYLSVAEGGHSEVVSPFSRRVLYPGIASLLSKITGAPLRYTFFFLSLLSFSLLAYSLAWFFNIFGLSPWLIAIFLLTPFPLIELEMGYMPDLFAVALTALSLLFLWREKYFYALFTLAICFPARENTLVVCVLLGIVAWTRKEYRLALGVVPVIVLGAALGTWFVRLGRPNIHHLPDAVYLMCKAPHQFLKNVFGIRIWSNTLPVDVPWVKFVLPPQLSWGAVREIGICPFNWDYPVFTLLTLLTLFGSMPLLLWRAWKTRFWLGSHPLAIQVATWVGGIGFLMGTSLGEAVDRLIGYGWPIFWITGPYIIAKFIPVADRKGLPLFYLTLVALAWCPELVHYSRWTADDFSKAMEVLIVTVIGYIFTWQLLRKINFRAVKAEAM